MAVGVAQNMVDRKQKGRATTPARGGDSPRKSPTKNNVPSGSPFASFGGSGGAYGLGSTNSSRRAAAGGDSLLAAPGVRELLGVSVYVAILAALMGAGMLEVQLMSGEGADRKAIFSNVAGESSCPSAPKCPAGVRTFFIYNEVNDLHLLLKIQLNLFAGFLFNSSIHRGRDNLPTNLQLQYSLA